MNIETSLEGLLYDHDCVIVPDFGGFVALYKSAEFGKNGDVMYPPSKGVSFNINLKNNDGLLANALAEKYGLSYNNAVQVIREHVSGYRSTLKEKKRLEISGVGVLYVDKSGNYRFTPQQDRNFLKSSFGLQKIYVKAIEPQKKTEEDSPVIQVNRKRWIAAAIAVPLLLAGGYFLSSSISNDKLNLANLNPFQHSQVVAEYTPSDIEVNKNAQDEKTVASFDEWVLAQGDAETAQYPLVDQEGSNGITVQLKEKVIEEAPQKAVPNARGYYVVGGAFAEKANADRMVTKLQEKGYNSFIFQKSGRLHMVCYGHFEKKSEARKALRSIKSNENASVWLKRL